LDQQSRPLTGAAFGGGVHGEREEKRFGAVTCGGIKA
jgi:hypothetical protein